MRRRLHWVARWCWRVCAGWDTKQSLRDPPQRSIQQLPDTGDIGGSFEIIMPIFAGKGAVVAALALGALTSYMAWRYIDQASQNANSVEMVPVVVAAMPIPA